MTPNPEIDLMNMLTSMTRAERAYMARRLPRTYRSMVERAERRAAAAFAKQRSGDRRRVRLLAFHRRRHAAAKDRKLSDLPRNARAMPRAVGYFEARCRTICRKVVTETGYEWTDLISNRRNQGLVRARQAAMYLLLEHTHMNLPQIGKLFGGRDHTTVIHARNRVAGAPAKYKNIIEPIELQLGVERNDKSRP